MAHRDSDKGDQAKHADSSPGPMGRDRVRDERGYYEHDAHDGPGPGPAPAPLGDGGSMGGGLAALDPAANSAPSTAGAEPAEGARGQVAGDSQGGTLSDATAADQQSAPSNRGH